MSHVSRPVAPPVAPRSHPARAPLAPASTPARPRFPPARALTRAKRVLQLRRVRHHPQDPVRDERHDQNRAPPGRLHNRKRQADITVPPNYITAAKQAPRKHTSRCLSVTSCFLPVRHPSPLPTVHVALARAIHGTPFNLQEQPQRQERVQVAARDVVSRVVKQSQLRSCQQTLALSRCWPLVPHRHFVRT